jgi:hypothetical protein
MDLFRANAPWSRAALIVKVFEVGPEFTMEAPDQMLLQVSSDLKRRGIALAIGAGWLPGSDMCGYHVEGFSHPGTAQSVARRFQGLGIDVAYVVFDEPLYYGHQYDRENGCRWSPDRVARELAASVKIFRQALTSAQFCDAEPIAFELSGGWTSKILQWTKTFQSATGLPLACFQMDVQWKGPWQQQLSELKTGLRGAGIKLGVMYTGDEKARTGLEWVQQSVQRARAVEANPATAPDQALLQSWMRQPDHILPETQPGTMTNLVLEYAQRR